MTIDEIWQWFGDNAGELGVIIAALTLLLAILAYRKQRKNKNSVIIKTKNHVGKNNSGTVIQSGRDSNIGDQ